MLTTMTDAGLVIQKWPDKIRIANPGAFRINVQEALVGGVSDPAK